MKTGAQGFQPWLGRLARSNGWVWVAIVLSTAVCALLAWLHFQHQQALTLAMARTESLRLARLELNKGFLYFSLADEEGAPFDQEQGLALIEQSVAEFQRTLDAFGQASGGAQTGAIDQQATIADFQQRAEAFEAALKHWKNAETDRAGAATDLRLAFFNLEYQAGQIDHLTVQSLVELRQRLNRIFGLTLFGAAVLLLGVCAIVLIVGRSQETANDALRESEGRFRALFANNHAPMMLIIPETGAIIDANPAACNFYGWAWEEITAMNISEINTLSPEEVLAEMQKALSEFRHYFMFRHCLSNGAVRDVEVFSGPIEFSGQKVLFSIVHDVTERRQAEAALEASEERYRTLLQTTPLGIGVHTVHGFQYMNPAGARLLGAGSPEQIIGRNVSEFLSSEQSAISRTHYELVLAGERELYPMEVVLRRQDGLSVPVETVMTPLTYQGMPAQQFIFSDIRERKQAQEKIMVAQAELQRLLREADESRQALLSVVEDQKRTEEQLNLLNANLERRVQERTAQLEVTNRELEAFAYSVSHDLRAPLRGIDGWSYALLEDYGETLNAEGRDYLARVRSEAKRMGQLIDDLLRLSRVTRAEMQLTRVDLSQLAEEIARRLQDEDNSRQIEITVEPGLSARADERLMEIMLNNLLSNAFKFTARTSPAQIHFGREHTLGTDALDVAAFYVRDNGVGFDMAYSAKLFGAFQRLHHQNEYPGTGIGLATVQRIVHRHGGQVWAEAEPGRGATFWFTLGE